MILVKQESDYQLYLDVNYEGRGLYMMRFLKSDQKQPGSQELSRFFLYANELENVVQHIQQSLKGKTQDEN